MNSTEKGRKGEDMAALYLQSMGYTLLCRNYVFEHCEIDLIAMDAETLVFVEVKLRSRGIARLSVDIRKQRRICRAALGYAVEGQKLQAPMRFDVIEVYQEGGQLRLHHIPRAFEFSKGGYFA